MNPNISFGIQPIFEAVLLERAAEKILRRPQESAHISILKPLQY